MDIEIEIDDDLIEKAKEFNPAQATFQELIEEALKTWIEIQTAKKNTIDTK